MDLIALTLEEQIAEVERELGMRRRVYPRFVEAGKMSRQKADRQVADLEAVLLTLRRLHDPDDRK